MRSSGILFLTMMLAAASALGQPESKFATPNALKGSTTPLLRAKLAQIPLHIIENRGVHPDPVRFYVEGKDKTIYFAPDGITFALHGRDDGWAVKLEFVGASPRVRLRGVDPRRAVFSYFLGPRADWKTALRSFGGVVYQDLWPGIDLVYAAEVGALKYRFVVKPGADPRRIRLRYRGATSITKTQEGTLQVETPVMEFDDEAPVAWVQDVAGARTPVESTYAVETRSGNAQVVGFEIGKYPADQELVIDPAVFVYCGFIGGGGEDGVSGVAVDQSGYAYIGGWTTDSRTFPIKVGPTKRPASSAAGFVMKLDPTGTQIIYCGLIAGGYYATDYISAIAVDRAGSAYVAGTTNNDEKSFPVVVGPDLTHNGGMDCFIAKVNPAGTSLEYCGYLGGQYGDRGKAIAVDASGCAYILGDTASPDISHSPPGTPFPTTVGPDTTYNGGGDAFVAKLDPTGTRWIYCGYVGGAGIEMAKAIAVDAKGCAYLVGQTSSDETTFPVTVGPRLTMWRSYGIDGFIAKVNAAGTQLDYCGYFGGGSQHDDLCAIAVDAGGHAYIGGMTASPEANLPLAVGPYLKNAGNADGIVAKLNPGGTGFVYCGMIGGAGGDGVWAIAVDAERNAFVAGHTASNEQSFPVRDAPQMHALGNIDAWVAMVDRSGRFLRYSGYIGGSYPEKACAVAVTQSGSLVVGGEVSSGEMSGFPVTVGPDLTHNLGGKDGFIARISFEDLTMAGSTAIGGTVTFDLKATNSANLPYQVGSSLGTGPIPIGGRKLGLSVDDLLVVSVSDALPAIFYHYRGVVDANGSARAELRIPNLAALVGLRIHTALVTIDAGAPQGIRTISDTKTFTVVQ